MVHAKSKLALSFDPRECRGFSPAAGNQVAIERIEGLQALGLTLIAATPEPRFTMPVVPTEAVDALLRETKKTAGKPRAVDPEKLMEGLPKIDWPAVFTEINRKEDGLAASVLARELENLQRPFERDEIKEVLSVEPRLTSLLNPLARVGDRWPGSWLSLLSWSNGGDFINGERCFQDMFSVAQVREYTTLYGIPNYLPDAIPFAMDGGAGIYFFDARQPPDAGEYPVVFCHSSEVGGGWEAVTPLNRSFLSCCQSKKSTIE